MEFADAAVATVKVQAWDGNYVQGIQLLNALNEQISSLQCENAKNPYTSFSLRKGHSILGIYGYMDASKHIRGFGFITGETHTK